MKLYALKCMRCPAEWQLQLDETKPIGEQVKKCPSCGSETYFVQPAEQVRKEPEVAEIQLFLTKQEYDYLLRLLNRKMYGISMVFKSQASLEQTGKHEVVRRAKESYPIVSRILEKLKSLRS